MLNHAACGLTCLTGSRYMQVIPGTYEPREVSCNVLKNTNKKPTKAFFSLPQKNSTLQEATSNDSQLPA